MQKTILITGATDGIGLKLAKRLVADGHKVIVHGRNENKLNTIVDDLKALGNVAGIVADLSDLNAVKQLANELARRYQSLDVVINNAGVYKIDQPILANGLDVRFVVNTIAPYLLTQMLLPMLGEDSRVINLASAAQSPVDMEALKGEKVIHDDFEAYAQSKLAIIMWTRFMAKKHQNGPLFIAVNPGSLLATKMVKQGFGVEGKDINIGVTVLEKLALSDEFAESSGKYFDNDIGAISDPHRDALDSHKNQQVVEVIAAVLKIHL